MEIIPHTCCGPGINPSILIRDTFKHLKVGRFTAEALAFKSITAQTTTNNNHQPTPDYKGFLQNKKVNTTPKAINVYQYDNVQRARIQRAI